MDMIIGLGEIGEGIHELLKYKRNVCGIDVKPFLSFGNFRKYTTPILNKLDVMHICVPYSKSFVNIVCTYIKEHPTNAVVIHSTIKPGTTRLISDIINEIPVFYSPIRGVHSRMLEDIMRYTKFYASYQKDNNLFEACFKDDCGLNVKNINDPYALEIMKPLMDTTYYGWMIAFWQLVDKVCKEHALSFDDMSSFTEEIQQFCNNRPSFYVDEKGIGGHCVLQNLELLEDVLPEVGKIILDINNETRQRYFKAIV